MEDASFRRFAGARLEAPPSSTALGDVVESDKRRVESNVELMSGVVAQIRSRRNMNLGEPGEASRQPSQGF